MTAAPKLPRIAVLGAGHVGPAIARVALDAGYPVTISGSGDPDNIVLIAQLLVPGADPVWAADAARAADLVVLAIPLHKFGTFDPALVSDKVVLDIMNYWPPIDGVQPLFEDADLGSSEIVQRRLPGARVVKTLNHIGYHDLEAERRPSGTPDRRALGVASDDPDAADLVTELIERIGYDPVQLDTLRAGRLLEPGNPVFGAMLTRAEFEQIISAEAAA